MVQEVVLAVRSEGSLKSPRRLSGSHGRQGPMNKVNFGIPEWGCPLPGMAPAAAPMKASQAALHLICAHGACSHAEKPCVAIPSILLCNQILLLPSFAGACSEIQRVVSCMYSGHPTARYTGPQGLLCMQRATKSLTRAQTVVKPSGRVKKATKSPVKPRSSTSPLHPGTPADHGIRKPDAAAQGRPEAQTLAEQPTQQQLKATAQQQPMSSAEVPMQRYPDWSPGVTGQQSARQEARTTAKTPAQLQVQLSAQQRPAQEPPALATQPPAHSAAAQGAESSAETPDEAPVSCAAMQLADVSAVSSAKAPGQLSSQVIARVPAQLLAGPLAEQQPESSAGSLAELSTDFAAEAAAGKPESTGIESLQLPHDPSAGRPSHSGADLTARPPTMLPAELADSALIELTAEPEADLLSVQGGEQSAELDHSHVAALEELRTYIESCGGTLDAAWTVHFDSRGRDGTMFTYLPPEVSHASPDGL